MNIERLNIIILPSQEMMDTLSTLSKAYAGKGNPSFILDGINYYPHITLFSPDFPIINLEKISKELSLVAKSTKSFELEFKEIIQTKNGGLSANYVLNEDALNLRNKVINVLNPLREGLIRDKYKNLENLSESEKSDTLEYGYPLNRYHFPHVTISHFKDTQFASKVFSKVDTSKFPTLLPVHTIAVCRMGELGTVIEVLNKFKLSN